MACHICTTNYSLITITFVPRKGTEGLVVCGLLSGHTPYKEKKKLGFYLRNSFLQSSEICEHSLRHRIVVAAVAQK